jgi:hypothetical protein
VHGDALHVFRDLPDNCVDAFVTDPPLLRGGVFRGDRVKETTAKRSVETPAPRPSFPRRILWSGPTTPHRMTMFWQQKSTSTWALSTV